jgi:hypothetical protein
MLLQVVVWSFIICVSATCFIFGYFVGKWRAYTESSRMIRGL